ncbi:MAG: hypothetical protein H6552_09395 [Chitinophagales bacterium]|nr:hypothetical protein [Chitinophagales bacterium]
MPYNPQKHHRRSIRLKGYDYAQAGLYFITICCQDRANLFGAIENGEMILNEYGQIAFEEWANTENIRDNCRIHEYIIMPNHIHGIIEIIFKKENNMDEALISNNSKEENLNSSTGEEIISDNKSESIISENTGKEIISDNKSESIISENKSESIISDNTGEEIISDNTGEEIISDNTGEEIISDNKSESIFFDSTGELQFAPTAPTEFPPTAPKFKSPSQTIGSIIRGFKIATIKRIKDLILKEKDNMSEALISNNSEEKNLNSSTGELQFAPMEFAQTEFAPTAPTEFASTAPIIPNNSEDSIISNNKSKEIISDNKSKSIFSDSTGELQFAPTEFAPTEFAPTASTEFAPTASTEKIKTLNYKIWQRNFYEHIIRNEKSHKAISDYIKNNPQNWNNDKLQ